MVAAVVKFAPSKEDAALQIDPYLAKHKATKSICFCFYKNTTEQEVNKATNVGTATSSTTALNSKISEWENLIFPNFIDPDNGLGICRL